MSTTTQKTADHGDFNVTPCPVVKSNPQDFTGAWFRRILAWLVMLLGIALVLISVYVCYVLLNLILLKLYTWMPSLMRLLAKIGDFFEIAVIGFLITCIYSSMADKMIAISLQLHPSERGTRFLVGGILSVALCLYAALPILFGRCLVIFHVEIDLWLLALTIWVGILLARYLFMLFWQIRHSLFRVGYFGIDPQKMQAGIFFDAYFYGPFYIISGQCKKHIQNSQKLFAIAARHLEGKSTRYLFLNPCTVKNKSLIPDQCIVMDLKTKKVSLTDPKLTSLPTSTLDKYRRLKLTWPK